MLELTEQLVALRPFLLRIARRRLRNDTWAEDAVSEVLVAALENPQAFRGQASARTWLVAILKNKLVDQIRRHTRECQLVSDDGEADFDSLADVRGIDGERASDWGDPQESLVRRQFMAQLDECLKTLPPHEGRAFKLRNLADADTRDICEALGVTANNLAVILHRARQHLREALPQWADIGQSARVSHAAHA